MLGFFYNLDGSLCKPPPQAGAIREDISFSFFFFELFPKHIIGRSGSRSQKLVRGGFLPRLLYEVVSEEVSLSSSKLVGLGFQRVLVKH